MSVLDHFFDGSLIGRERLLQARGFYTPSRATMLPHAAFTHWTKRVSVQSEIGSAREMAGMDESQLNLLEGEFIRCETRPRAAWARHGLWVGALFTALACIGFALSDLAGIEAVATRALSASAVALLLAGLGCIVVSGLTAFGAMHLDLSYGTTGLFVGLLDEQHPWLYKALGLLRHDAAESYRQTVIRERGPLRGLDYVMMRELVAAHEVLERMRPAKAVAEQLRHCPEQIEPIETLIAEPRLVQVGSGTHAAPVRTSERTAAKVKVA